MPGDTSVGLFAFTVVFLATCTVNVVVALVNRRFLAVAMTSTKVVFVVLLLQNGHPVSDKLPPRAPAHLLLSVASRRPRPHSVLPRERSPVHVPLEK